MKTSSCPDRIIPGSVVLSESLADPTSTNTFCPSDARGMNPDKDSPFLGDPISFMDPGVVSSISPLPETNPSGNDLLPRTSSLVPMSGGVSKIHSLVSASSFKKLSDSLPIPSCISLVGGVPIV